MKRIFTSAAFVAVLCFLSSIFAPLVVLPAERKVPETVKIVAPDGFSTRVLSQPGPKAEVLTIALNGDILEVLGRKDGYLEVRLPEAKTSGFVLQEHTIPWKVTEREPRSRFLLLAIGFGAAIFAAVVFLLVRARRLRQLERAAGLISESIRVAEELFRSGDYSEAIERFREYVELHEGRVRNPDVYRRLSVCYLKTGQIDKAAQSWQKMSDLGGVRKTEDYSLGVKIMTALGEEAAAARICEQLLDIETDEDKAYEIRKNLLAIYRRLRKPQQLVKHALELTVGGTAEPEVVADTARFLIAEKQTDLAIEAKSRDLVTRIGEEFLEEKVMTPEAERIYLKCLQYDRTDLRFHRILAEQYRKEGSFRNAVSELIILHQLDKENADQYMEQAAKIYVENLRVVDALAEGNPIIIKKIAQMFLVRSDVSSDAVAVYEKIAELQPTAIAVNKMLSTVYLTRGDLKKYVEKLQLLHRIDGANHDYMSDLARCIIDNDLLEETMRQGGRELKIKVLKQLIKRGAPDDKAVAMLETLLRNEPANAIVVGALARAHARRGDYAKALEYLLALEALKPIDDIIARRAVDIALEHGLLPSILSKGNEKILLITARELMKRQAEDALSAQVLLKALKENPKEVAIKHYLEAHGFETIPEPHPSQAVELAQSTVKSTEGSDTRSREAPGMSQETLGPQAAVDLKERELVAGGKPPTERSIEAQHGIPTSISIGEKPDAWSPKPMPSVDAPTIEQAVLVQGTPEKVAQAYPVTTFVTAHSKGTALVQYSKDELFVPAEGGLAYKDVAAISSDGWGALYSAIEVNTRRNVLLRVLKKDLLEEELMEAFVGEATQLGFSMVHDNILDLKEVVRGPGKAAGFVCSYMPRTLEQVIRSGQRLDMETAIRLIRQIISGLTYAATYKGSDGKVRRTYHFHLQPSQILVNDDLKTCRIASLGYTQLFRNVTRARQPRWKDPCMNPAFMAPELFPPKGLSIVERVVDVYAVGLVMYLMVTGELPFGGPSFDEYKFQHSRAFPLSPGEVNPAVPPWLDSMILLCLEKDPARRWTSVIEIQKAMAKELAHSGG